MPPRFPNGGIQGPTDPRTQGLRDPGTQGLEDPGQEFGSLGLWVRGFVGPWVPEPKDQGTRDPRTQGPSDPGTPRGKGLGPWVPGSQGP